MRQTNYMSLNRPATKPSICTQHLTMKGTKKTWSLRLKWRNLLRRLPHLLTMQTLHSSSALLHSAQVASDSVSGELSNMWPRKICQKCFHACFFMYAVLTALISCIFCRWQWWSSTDRKHRLPFQFHCINEHAAAGGSATNSATARCSHASLSSNLCGMWRAPHLTILAPHSGMWSILAVQPCTHDHWLGITLLQVHHPKNSCWLPVLASVTSFCTTTFFDAARNFKVVWMHCDLHAT